jgi:hypothetical protein
MHRPSTVLATVLLTLAFTATASASSYCVAPATGCDHTASSVQDALTQAATAPGDDSISLGAATYAQDNLSYAPGDNARVSISGTGATTIIQRATASASAITLRATTGPVDLADLRVVAAGASGTSALELDMGATVRRVEVTAAGGATGPLGIEVTSPATISDSVIHVAGNGSCVLTHGTGTVSILDSDLANCSAAVSAQSARVFAQRLRITDVVNGISVAGNANVTANFDDSVVVMRNSAGFAAGAAMFGSATATLYVNQDTFIGVGGGTGVSAFNHASTGLARLEVYDSIMRGFTYPLQADSDSAAHPATLTADFNNYDGATHTVNFGTLSSDHFSNADPLFVDGAAGDYHLQASSPVIDLDPEPLVTLWDESPTDLDGSLRIINGNRDYGAFERLLAPGAATGDATDVTQTSATVPATANGGGGNATVKLVYGPTASYGGEMQFDPLAPSLSDQPYSIGLVGLAPNTTYHYALVVTNTSGTTTSADRSFTTQATPVTPPTVCCTPPPVAKAALSALTISPSRFTAASKGATFARTRTGATVRFTLSAAGTVKFTVLRAKRVKGRTRYVKVGKTISRAGKTGANRLRFSGRVNGKKLRPGRYRLQSVDPAGGTKRVSFTIVRR